jgi:glycosyltransferase involved in cell wall biosynthesis
MTSASRAIHVVSSIANEAAGPSYSVVRLCQSLIDLGEDISLATLDPASSATNSSFAKTFVHGVGPRRLGRSPAMRQWLTSQARTRSVDILHSHGIWMMPNVYPGWIADRYELRLVVSPRGMMSEWAMRNGSLTKRAIWPLLQRPALESAACFHATSATEYDDVRRLGFQQPVAVIPNGIDIPVASQKTSRGLRTLLFLGRVHPKKGLDLLLQAWKRVQDRFPDWELRIVGPDENGYVTRLRQLSGELRLTRVEFCDALYGEEKQQAYRDADLFVLPTRSENFGMVVAESLASATPVIVSKGAPWSGLEERRAGWWIDIGVEPLAACLSDAMACSREVLADMGMRGRAWMEAEYSWTEIGRRMAETYHWLRNDRDRPDCVRAA